MTAPLNLALDYNGTLDTALESHGISVSRLQALDPRIAEVHAEIERDRAVGVLGFVTLPFQFRDSPASLARLRSVADAVAARADAHVVLGIGGSYLGARMLLDALGHPYRNELGREARGGRPRLYFEGNSMDTDALAGLRDVLAAGGTGEYTVHVISKSGGTLETAVIFRMMLAELIARHGEQVRDRVVVTTDPGSPLHRLAERYGFAAFEIPANVGGRYSVLTPVGLLPAAVGGIDVEQLVAGAAAMAAACEEPSLTRNPAYLYAALQYLGYRERGWSVSVMAVWEKKLEAFGLWYDQLCAESLGKDGVGRTPLTSVNTRDLHSRGQQHQEGARDKLITNLFVRQPQREPIPVPALEGNPDSLDYLRGRPLHALLQTAALATRYAYHEAGRPTIDLWLRDTSPYTLGQLIYLFELATVAEGKLLAINPLDQPGVEAYKNYMFGILGREDRRAYRERFAARAPDRAEFVAGDPSLVPED